MFKTIDYRATRALQICIVFVTTLAIQRWLNYSHAGWIGFAVMMIYAGFDSGASLHRTYHRFWGALFGLLLSYILWCLGQLDYRLIILIIPIIVFLAYFSLGKFYVYPTIFTVTLTALGTDYYSNSSYFVANFFFDYFRSTLIALAICVLFEYFVFKKSNLSHKLYEELQRSIVTLLEQLFMIVTKQPLHRSHFLKLSVQLNAKIIELNTFVSTAPHDFHLDPHQFDALKLFNCHINQIYQSIRQLFVSSPIVLKPLVLETQLAIDQLIILRQTGL